MFLILNLFEVYWKDKKRDDFINNVSFILMCFIYYQGRKEYNYEIKYFQFYQCFYRENKDVLYIYLFCFICKKNNNSL